MYRLLQLILNYFTRAPGELVARYRVLNVARKELGNGEIGGNNKGRHVRKYCNGRETLWCAYFVSWCIRQISPKFPPFGNAKRLCAYLEKHGEKLSNPEPGCVFLLHRGHRGSRKGHTGFVAAVFTPSEYVSIEGNFGPYPAEVRRVLRDTGDPNFIGFYRLP